MASSATPIGPGDAPARSPGDETRQRLIDATTRCLEKFGIAKTGVIDIVREAGSSRQTAYRYFSGRRELIYSAFVQASTRLLERIPAAVERHREPLDVLVETLLFLFRELPRDEILSQAFGPGALASLRPIGSDQAATTQLSRISLAPYLHAVGGLDDADLDLLAEHVNRLVLSAMLLAEGDSLLRADEPAREKLRAWFGPTVERHLAAHKRRPGRAAPKSRAR